jgi:hypothetical protein
VLFVPALLILDKLLNFHVPRSEVMPLNLFLLHFLIFGYSEYTQVLKVMGQLYINSFLSGATYPCRFGNALISISCEVFSRESG